MSIDCKLFAFHDQTEKLVCTPSAWIVVNRLQRVA